MNDLDELMKLREAATPGPWAVAFYTRVCSETKQKEVASCEEDKVPLKQRENNAAYIVAACNAVPKMVERIMELEAQRDWLAQAAANAGWHGVRVSKEYMIEQSRMAGFVHGEPHECPTPEVSCHARDEQICMSDNHIACAQAVNRASFIMRRFTEVK